MKNKIDFVLEEMKLAAFGDDIICNAGFEMDDILSQIQVQELIGCSFFRVYNNWQD